MMICCGKERDTNFCPDCGTQLREAIGATLLAHLRYQAKRLTNRKDSKDKSMGPKYDRWAKWVQEQIGKSNGAVESKESDGIG